MKQQTFAAVAGSALLVPVLVSAGTAEYLTRAAVDREPPRSFARRREKAKPMPDPALDSARERLRQSPHQRVEISAYDGTRLTGHWFPHPDAKRVIVAIHGWRSHWYRDFGAISEFWKEQGCSVLYVEQRAHDTSGGQHMTYGAVERYDCQAWLRWVCKQCGIKLPIYLAGVSMGATTVLMAGALSLPGNVRGIVADCGFTSADEIWCHLARDSLHMPYRMVRRFANAKYLRRTGQTSALSTVDALKNCRLPVLLIHGDADDFVPPEMSRRNEKACAGQKRLVMVPGAGHGMSSFVGKELYEQELLAFWAAHDADSGEPGQQPV